MKAIIKTAEENRVALGLIERLMDGDPAKDTEEGKLLTLLASAVVIFERKYDKASDSIEKVVTAQHIKWLSKAKTAKIDGSEMTVLPYGYLGQAIKEVLTEERSQIVKLIEDIKGQSFERMGYTGEKAVREQIIDTILNALNSK